MNKMSETSDQSPQQDQTTMGDALQPRPKRAKTKAASNETSNAETFCRNFKNPASETMKNEVMVNLEEDGITTITTSPNPDLSAMRIELNSLMDFSISGEH